MPVEALAAERFLKPLLQGEVARSAGGVLNNGVTTTVTHEERSDEAIYFFSHTVEIAPLRSVFIKHLPYFMQMFMFRACCKTSGINKPAPVFASLRSQ